MNGFSAFWLTVTPPQATIIAAMLAVLGAILARIMQRFDGYGALGAALV